MLSEPIKVFLGNNCSSLSALSSFSWVLLVEAQHGTVVTIYRNFVDTLNALHEEPDFCVGILHCETARSSIRELDEFLVKIEDEVDEDILLG